MNDKNLLPDIILLCETFLSEKNFSRYSFHDYELVSRYRKEKSRGGVTIMVKSHINYIERPDLGIFEEGKFESIFVEIPRKGKCSVIVGEIYRVPGTNENEFIEKYESIVAKIKSERKRLIIGTDQNLDYLKIHTHTNTMKFFEMNISNNVIPTIYRPTRVTHTSATLIDNIYVDSEMYRNVKSHIIKSDISDHFMCLTMIFDNFPRAHNCQNQKYRKVTDSVLRNIKASLLNRNWQVLHDMTLNEGSEFLISEIQKLMDFYAPERQTVSRPKNRLKSDWVTQGLTVSAKKCFRMYKKVASKPRDSPEFENYKRYRNLYNTLRRKAKFVYYNDLIQSNMNDAKTLWKILHKLTGKLSNKKDISDEITVNGVKVDDENVISNAFAKYYSELGKSLSDKITSAGNIKDPMINMKNKVEQNCFLFPTSALEIEKFIRSLKVKDSRGYDEISNRILKKIYPGIINALDILFNMSLQQGFFPENMKLAVVKPLYKGKSKTEIINYRPISLLPVISKILEKIVNVRFVKFFVKHKVLYEGQYGFRENRSTTDAILDFTGNVVSNINKGHYTLALFLDMSKAFDSIKHDTLLKKTRILWN